MPDAHVYTCIRVRPPVDGSQSTMRMEIHPSKTSLTTIRDFNMISTASRSSTETKYTFDHIFDESSQNADVFSKIWPRLRTKIFHGDNANFCVYGQTGSGKTHTVDGIIECLLPNLFTDLDEISTSLNVSISYVQIYMDSVYDLLNKNKLIVSSKARFSDIDSLTTISVKNPAAVETLLKESQRYKKKSGHALNKMSSRSHTILKVSFRFTTPDSSEVFSPNLFLVDLAGSERNSRTLSRGTLFDEGCQINKSLSCLAKCLECMTQRCTLIPYRESALTMFLREALGSSGFTLVCCIAPEQSNESETRSTIKFATVARRVVSHRQSLADQSKRRNMREQHEEELQTRLTEQRSRYEEEIDILKKKLMNVQSTGMKYQQQCDEMRNRYAFMRQQTERHEMTIRNLRTKNEALQKSAKGESSHSLEKLLDVEMRKTHASATLYMKKSTLFSKEAITAIRHGSSQQLQRNKQIETVLREEVERRSRLIEAESLGRMKVLQSFCRGLSHNQPTKGESSYSSDKLFHIELRKTHASAKLSMQKSALFSKEALSTIRHVSIQQVQHNKQLETVRREEVEQRSRLMEVESLERMHVLKSFCLGLSGGQPSKPVHVTVEPPKRRSLSVFTRFLPKPKEDPELRVQEVQQRTLEEYAALMRLQEIENNARLAASRDCLSGANDIYVSLQKALAETQSIAHCTVIGEQNDALQIDRDALATEAQRLQRKLTKSLRSLDRITTEKAVLQIKSKEAISRGEIASRESEKRRKIFTEALRAFTRVIQRNRLIADEARRRSRIEVYAMQITQSYFQKFVRVISGEFAMTSQSTQKREAELQKAVISSQNRVRDVFDDNKRLIGTIERKNEEIQLFAHRYNNVKAQWGLRIDELSARCETLVDFIVLQNASIGENLIVIFAKSTLALEASQALSRMAASYWAALAAQYYDTSIMYLDTADRLSFELEESSEVFATKSLECDDWQSKALLWKTRCESVAKVLHGKSIIDIPEVLEESGDALLGSGFELFLNTLIRLVPPRAKLQSSLRPAPAMPNTSQRPSAARASYSGPKVLPTRPTFDTTRKSFAGKSSQIPSSSSRPTKITAPSKPNPVVNRTRPTIRSAYSTPSPTNQRTQKSQAFTPQAHPSPSITTMRVSPYRIPALPLSSMHRGKHSPSPSGKTPCKCSVCVGAFA